jgi:hypothetical protein
MVSLVAETFEGPSEVFIFGAFSHHAGHYLYTVDRREVRMYGGEVPKAVHCGCDGNLPRAQPEGGLARTSHADPEWSYVSWFDRQGDAREGSHTGILARGKWSIDQLMSAARRLTPWAFRVEVSRG